MLLHRSKPLARASSTPSTKDSFTRFPMGHSYGCSCARRSSLGIVRRWAFFLELLAAPLFFLRKRPPLTRRGSSLLPSSDRSGFVQCGCGPGLIPKRRRLVGGVSCSFTLWGLRRKNGRRRWHRRLSLFLWLLRKLCSRTGGPEALEASLQGNAAVTASRRACHLFVCASTCLRL